MCTSLLLPFSTRAETYSFTEIADTSQFTQGFGAFGPAINNTGEVAFLGFGDGGAQGIFTGSGGALTVVADTTSGFTGFGDSVRINEGGTVAFRADTTAGGTGIFTGTGGAIATIVTTGGTFTELFGHYINNSGTVAFYASLPDGSVGIFTGSGGAIKTVTDTTGAFSCLEVRQSVRMEPLGSLRTWTRAAAEFLRSTPKEAWPLSLIPAEGLLI